MSMKVHAKHTSRYWVQPEGGPELVLDSWAEPLCAEASRRADGLWVASWVQEDRAVDSGSPLDEMPDQGDCEYVGFDGSGRVEDWIAETLTSCAVCGEQAVLHSEAHCGPYVPPTNEWARAFMERRAFWVERYEHGLVRYALVGEASVDGPWDVATPVGVLRLDGSWPEPEAQARQILEEFSAWCNGEVYGVSHALFSADGALRDIEEVWDVIGFEAAQRMMLEEHRWWVDERRETGA